MADWSTPNYAALINDLNDRIATGTPKLDPNLISGLFDAYKSGKDYAYEQRNRDAFKKGVPDNPTDVYRTILQAGGTGPALGVLSADVARENLILGQRQTDLLARSQGLPGNPTPVSGGLFPPSTSQGGVRPTAPPVTGPQPAPTPGATFPPSGTTAINGIGAESVRTIFGKAFNGDEAAVGPLLDNLGRNRPEGFLDRPLKPEEAASVAQTAARMAASRNGGGPTPSPSPPAPMGPLPPPPAGNPAATDAIQPRAVPTTSIPAVNPAQVVQNRFPATPLPSVADRAVPPGTDPDAQFKQGLYSVLSASPNPGVAKSAHTLLENLLKNNSPTPRMKEWVEAVRSGTTKLPFDQWDVENEQQKSNAKKLGEGFATDYIELRKAGRSGNDAMAQLNVLEQTLKSDKFYSGTQGERVLMLKRAIASLGGDPSGVADMETFQGAANAAVVKTLGGLGQGISNADRSFIVSSFPSLDTSKQGNLAKIEIAKRVAQRQVDVAVMANQYAQKHNGQLDAGFDAELNEWSKKNPLIDSSTERRVQALVRKPSGQSQSAPAAIEDGRTAINPNTGERVIRQNGKWVPFS